MKFFNKKNNSGFTLIETMVALFIMTIAIVALLTSISSSLFTARYSKNEFTANYLIQEVFDYVRNDRDTTALQHYGGGTWASFIGTYGSSIAPLSSCFTVDGCDIEPIVGSSSISPCTGTPTGGFTLKCKTLYYDSNASNKDFYTYTNLSGSLPTSNFKRRVTMALVTPYVGVGGTGPDELDVTVTVEWLNGNLIRSRSSTISLLNWQQ